MKLVSNLDDALVFSGVCVVCLWYSGPLCVLETVVLHNGRRVYLYRFLARFPLINWSTLFFLKNNLQIFYLVLENKNEK